MIEEAIETVDYVLVFLKDTDAMIIDLRDNKGGSPVLLRSIFVIFLLKNIIISQSYSCIFLLALTQQVLLKFFHLL